MLLIWSIHYLDTREKEFKTRHLCLDTDELEPVTKAAVELCSEMERAGAGRWMLRHRHLFHERESSGDEVNELAGEHRHVHCFSPADYVEDENGSELSNKQMAVILTGDPNAVMFPASMKKHHVEFSLAPKPSVDVDQIQIPEADLDALAYFSRDFREMEATTFLTEGPGTITFADSIEPEVKTAASEDEIRSFVTIFRRLYMAREPGNFLKAAEAFARAVLPHPVGKWVQGLAAEYQQDLDSVPDLVPFAREDQVTFTRKRLVDVFLYTQYAHQGEQKRERQYAEYLAQVRGRRGVLFWLFLTSMWCCALHVRNAGLQIASFVEYYCKCHGLSPSAVGSAAGYVGMGQIEKRRDREARILREKAEELATTLWRNAGHPKGGPTGFLDQALAQLRAATGIDRP